MQQHNLECADFESEPDPQEQLLREADFEAYHCKFRKREFFY
jgi:hypothetical protein